MFYDLSFFFSGKPAIVFEYSFRDPRFSNIMKLACHAYLLHDISGQFERFSDDDGDRAHAFNVSWTLRVGCCRQFEKCVHIPGINISWLSLYARRVGGSRGLTISQAAHFWSKIW